MAKDYTDETVKLQVPGVGEVWFGIQAMAKIQTHRDQAAIHGINIKPPGGDVALAKARIKDRHAKPVQFQVGVSGRQAMKAQVAKRSQDDRKDYMILLQFAKELQDEIRVGRQTVAEAEAAKRELERKLEQEHQRKADLARRFMTLKKRLVHLNAESKRYEERVKLYDLGQQPGTSKDEYYRLVQAMIMDNQQLRYLLGDEAPVPLAITGGVAEDRLPEDRVNSLGDRKQLGNLMVEVKRIPERGTQSKHVMFTNIDNLEPLNWGDALVQLKKRGRTSVKEAIVAAFKECERPFKFECSPASMKKDALFEFVLLPMPELAGKNPDSSYFQQHITKSGAKLAVAFPAHEKGMKGSKSVLVVPVPGKTQPDYSNALQFVRHAAPEQTDDVFQLLGEQIENMIDKVSVCYVCTDGRSVPWCHFRIDSDNKYIHHMPFRTM
jgi:hypothetical protein